MRYSRIVVMTAILTTLGAVPARLSAQRSIELFAGGGVTAGDVGSWAGYPAYDWNETLYDGHAQFLLGGAGGLRFGIEVGYSYLMWYSFNDCPGCPSPTHIERDVSSSRAMAVARFESPTRIFIEVAGGVQHFDDFTDLGGFAGLGYRIPLAGNLELPIKLRAGVILDSDQNLYPIALSAGLSWKLP
jgi:hypothetical protein